MSSLARAMETAPAPLPLGLLAALERLYQENPAALMRFTAAITTPEHTQSVTLHFANFSLVYSEFRSTAK